MSLYLRTQNSRHSTIINFPQRETQPQTAPQSTPIQHIPSADPFQERFGHQLPRGLREEAHGMEWRTFINNYAPMGNLRINNLESQALRGGLFRFNATMITNSEQHRSTIDAEIIATGPVSACTNLLADAGRRIEILEFHQFDIFEATVTFIYTCNNVHRTWAMGFGGTPEHSAAAAMSSAAHLIYG
ncbi:acetyl-CoA acetyltransferase [Corynebacterium callunae]|uniref:acetyl-CoA acetyltransferase n=1 Tax=Corynebacterium callunae TaxID=1721 RepID=UPI003982BC3E